VLLRPLDEGHSSSQQLHGRRRQPIRSSVRESVLPQAIYEFGFLKAAQGAIKSAFLEVGVGSPRPPIFQGSRPYRGQDSSILHGTRAERDKNIPHPLAVQQSAKVVDTLQKAALVSARYRGTLAILTTLDLIALGHVASPPPASTMVTLLSEVGNFAGLATVARAASVAAAGRAAKLPTR
jgi:hypothetical protein